MLGVLGALLLGNLATGLYACWEFDVEAPPLGVDRGATHLLFIAHGLHDHAADWPGPLADIARERLDPAVWQVVAYDWSAHSDHALRAAANARVIGRKLGAVAATWPRLRHIQLVAHSVGSFLIKALCDGYRASGGGASVHQTFLDPFGMVGMHDWGFGVRHFGECGDFAEAFVNLDDDVPTTNEPLLHAHNFDVTSARGKHLLNRPAHWWPVAFFREHVRAGRCLGELCGGTAATHATFEAGQTTALARP